MRLIKAQHYREPVQKEYQILHPTGSFLFVIRSLEPPFRGDAKSNIRNVRMKNREEGSRRLRFPENKRELFEALSTVGGNMGELIARIEWKNVQPYMIYSAALSRMPENYQFAVADENFDPIRAFEDALASVEFRSNLIEDLLLAFPEKKRILFVHIPRTAGTSMEAALSASGPFVSAFLMERALFTDRELLSNVASIVAKLHSSDHISVGGHVPLAWFLDHNLFRASDRIFTIVRAPIDMAISWANYVSTVLISDPQAERSDTKKWLAQLGVGVDDLSSLDFRALTLTILFNDEISPHNKICMYLGGGSLETSFTDLCRCNLEICLYEDYQEWVTKGWQVDLPKDKMMQSANSLRIDDLTFEERRRLIGRLSDDLVLYDALERLPVDAARRRKSIHLPRILR